MPLLEWIVQRIVGLFRSDEYRWEGEAKMISVSIFNAIVYLIFFAYDFVGPLVEAATGGQVNMATWQGVALSTVLIAGGSNLIHQVFSTKK